MTKEHEANTPKVDGRKSAPDPASDQLELLRGLKDVARAESIRNPMGHAAGAWRRVAAVLDRIAPEPKPEPAAEPEPKGRDR